MQQVTGAIQSITASTVKVKGLVDEVNEASRQQAQGIDQVSQAITRMERVTQGAAATAEESAAVSEELNAQAEKSLQVVTGLAALVGGDTATPAAPVVRAQPRTLVMSPRPRKGAADRHDEEGPRGTGTFGRF